MKRQNRGGILPRRDNRTENRTQEPQYGHGIRLSVRVFLLVILQVCVVSRLGFFGATPDILLAYLVVLGVTGRDAQRWKAVSVSGIAMGFLADALGGVGIGFLALFYFLVGAVVSNLMRRSYRGVFEELLFFYAALAPVAVLRAGVTLIYVLAEGQSGFSLGACALGILLPELLGTLLFALPVFFLFRGRD